MALISHALLGLNIEALTLMCFSSEIRTVVREPEHCRSALHFVAYTSSQWELRLSSQCQRNKVQTHSLHYDKLRVDLRLLRCTYTNFFYDVSTRNSIVIRRWYNILWQQAITTSEYSVTQNYFKIIALKESSLSLLHPLILPEDKDIAEMCKSVSVFNM